MSHRRDASGRFATAEARRTEPHPARGEVHSEYHRTTSPGRPSPNPKRTGDGGRTGNAGDHNGRR